MYGQSTAAEVQLRLGTRNGQTVFHIGEVIGINLTYSLAEGSDRTYVIPIANYGRSGRLGVENYNIEPSTFASTPLDIPSNEVTLQIIPATSVWQAETLRAAQSKLNEPASLPELYWFSQTSIASGPWRSFVNSESLGEQHRSTSCAECD